MYFQAKNIHKSYGQKEVLKGIDLSINKGDVVAILGPSGSGKTTFLRCLNFLNTAEKGTIIFNDKVYETGCLTSKEIREYRLETAFVFQNFNLFANMTALENVMEGLVTARKMNKEEALKIARNALTKVEMLEWENHFPSQLSGGQQQRVAIARALATNPKIIFFDEPTSALDPELINGILNIMRRLANEGMTMIVVTHEMSFAKNVSNKVILMENGEVIEEGDSQSFFNNPQQQRTKEFISSIMNH